MSAPTMIADPVLLRRQPQSTVVQSCQSSYLQKSDALEQNASEIRFKIQSPSASAILDGASVKIVVPMRYTYGHNVALAQTRVAIENQHTMTGTSAPQYTEGNDEAGTLDVRTAGSFAAAPDLTAGNQNAMWSVLPGPGAWCKRAIRTMQFSMGAASLQFNHDDCSAEMIDEIKLNSKKA